MNSVVNMIWLIVLSIIIIALVIGLYIWQAKEYKTRRTIREAMQDKEKKADEEKTDN